MLVNHRIPDSVKNDIHTEYLRQRQAYAEIAEKANVDVDVIETHFLEMTTARVTFFRQKKKSKPSLFNFYQKKQRTLGILKSIF
jgi:hypothetical protein